jgi:hypothetical protein
MGINFLNSIGNMGRYLFTGSPQVAPVTVQDMYNQGRPPAAMQPMPFINGSPGGQMVPMPFNPSNPGGQMINMGMMNPSMMVQPGANMIPGMAQGVMMPTIYGGGGDQNLAASMGMY